MNLENILNNLGLSKNEAKIYLAALEMGVSPAQDIARKAGIIRTTGYSILEQLVKKKLAHKTKEKNKTRYIAEDPKNLNKRFEDYQKELEKKLPELQAIYNRQEVKPQIRFYEGEDAVKTAFYEPLDQAEYSDSLVFSNSEELNTEFMHDIVIDFMEKRTAKKIYNRSLAEDTSFLRDIQKNDKKQFRNMILIDSKKYPCIDRINIYGKKVSIISFKNKMVFTIESESVVRTFRSLFELAWAGAQKLGKVSPDPYIPKKSK